VYVASSCDAANTVSASVEYSPPAAVGKFLGTNITVAVGVIDANGDTCGISGSGTCYIVVKGTSGDSASLALAFSAPATTLASNSGILGNKTDTVTAHYFPGGDTVVAEQCDPAATPATVATNCDTANAQSGVASSAGTVTFAAPITMVVGSDYSDAASGTCAFGGTCLVIFTDSNNSAISFKYSVTMAAPNVVLVPTMQGTGMKVMVTATNYPIGESGSAQECDTAATLSNIATNCDPATQLGPVAVNSGGKVPFGASLSVLSTSKSPFYADSSSPHATCAAGDTVGHGDPCFVGVSIAGNPTATVLTPLSITS
jgi:hypothetical protein